MQRRSAPAGLGSLNKVLNNLSRQALLDFGDARRIRKMRVGTWDVTRHAVDPLTLIPKKRETRKCPITWAFKIA